MDAYLGGQLDQELDDIQRRFGKEEAAAAVQPVRHWAERYGAVARRWAPLQAPPSAAEALERVRRSCHQLILNVTENCDLRCRYCGFSGIYQYFRVRSTQRTSASWRDIPLNRRWLSVGGVSDALPLTRP